MVDVGDGEWWLGLVGWWVGGWGLVGGVGRWGVWGERGVGMRSGGCEVGCNWDGGGEGGQVQGTSRSQYNRN